MRPMTDTFSLPEDTQDEEQWEAFLLLALEQLDGQQSTGLSNSGLAEVEDIVGHQLPFEVGLLLILGVPEDERWYRWAENPQAIWAEWNAYLYGGVLFDVEENDVWNADWGPRPADADGRKEVVASLIQHAPPLFPLYGHRAIPLTPATNRDEAMGNPVLSVVQTDVIVYGDDLAAWMHREFEVPLPTWQGDNERRFPFWTDLIEA